MFKQVQKAYDILGDDVKRDHYDKTGDENQTKKDGPEKILMAIFSAIIASGDFHGNIIDRIVEKLDAEVAGLKISKRKAETEIDDMIKLKGRVSTGGENLFEMVLDGTIEQLRVSLVSTEGKILEMVSMRDFLGEYSDDKPEAEQQDMGGLLGVLQREAAQGHFGQGPFRQGP